MSASITSSLHNKIMQYYSIQYTLGITHHLPFDLHFACYMQVEYTIGGPPIRQVKGVRIAYWLETRVLLSVRENGRGATERDGKMRPTTTIFPVHSFDVRHQSVSRKI